MRHSGPTTRLLPPFLAALVTLAVLTGCVGSQEQSSAGEFSVGSAARGENSLKASSPSTETLPTAVPTSVGECQENMVLVPGQGCDLTDNNATFFVNNHGLACVASQDASTLRRPVSEEIFGMKVEGTLDVEGAFCQSGDLDWTSLISARSRGRDSWEISKVGISGPDSQRHSASDRPAENQEQSPIGSQEASPRESSATSGSGLGALQQAVRKGDVARAKQLLAAGADPNTVNGFGDTPLGTAINNDDIQMVETLVEEGANANGVDGAGNRFIHSAVRRNNHELVRVLVNGGADPNTRDAVGNPVAQVAIVKNNPDMMRVLLEGGADANGTSFIGNPLLHEALTLGTNPEIVRILMEAGADANAAEKASRFSIGDELSALQRAIMMEEVELVRFMVEAGADVRARTNSRGYSALEVAMRVGNDQILQMLLASTRTRDRPGSGPTNEPGEPMANETPIPSSNTTSEPPGTPRRLRARAQGDSEIELSWRQPRSRGEEGISGYRIEVSPDGATWEDLVVDTGSSATMYTDSNLMGGTTRYYRVSAINEAGPGLPSAVIDATTDLCGGYQDLRQAILSGNPEFVQCLIRVGGQDANAKDPNGYPLLYWALSQRSESMIQALVDTGANVNDEGPRGYPMLFHAILEEDPLLVQILLAAGADVNARDANERSMLFWAEAQDLPEIAQVLREAGAKE